jgi:hypothetical protein
LSRVALELNSKEQIKINRINSVKKEIERKFLQVYPNQNHQLEKSYQLSFAKQSRDTLIKFFIYQNSLTINEYDISYLDCWNKKINSDASKLKAKQSLNNEISELEKRYGQNARVWLNKLGQDRFMLVKRDQCKFYEGELDEFRLNPKSIEDFERFLSEYSLSEEKVEIEKSTIQNKYNESVSKLKKGLSQQEQNKIDELLRDTQCLTDGKMSFHFESVNLGNFDYSIPSPTIDYDRMNEALAIVLNDHYQNNSLRTGSMPYAYCYGSKNSGSSSVKVNNGNQDLLVLVKNRIGEVMRHVYIQKFDSYTLRMPNGEYEVFFYNGKGWNPKKYMKDSPCGRIQGGFIYFEDLSKDPESLYLFNQVMEYTLQLHSGGNFNTANSSVTEAF